MKPTDPVVPGPPLEEVLIAQLVVANEAALDLCRPISSFGHIQSISSSLTKPHEQQRC